MSAKSKVFIVQNPEKKNVDNAKSFGEIQVILEGHEPTTLAISKLEAALKDIQPTDYLLLVGKSINMGLATHIALLNTGGDINILTWKWEKQAYEKEQIHIDNEYTYSN